MWTANVNQQFNLETGSDSWRFDIKVTLNVNLLHSDSWESINTSALLFVSESLLFIDQVMCLLLDSTKVWCEERVLLELTLKLPRRPTDILSSSSDAWKSETQTEEQ